MAYLLNSDRFLFPLRSASQDLIGKGLPEVLARSQIYLLNEQLLTKNQKNRLATYSLFPDCHAKMFKGEYTS